MDDSATRTDSRHAAESLDLALIRPVLVVGSPPPHGRDLDLLARPEDATLIRAWLGQAGFLPWRHIWARFGEPGPYAVELATTESWRTRRDDASCLFADPVPIPGYRHLVSPGPATVLLLAARNTAQRRGLFTEKVRRRMSQALERDPSAWAVAEARAPGLGLLGPLHQLRVAYRAGRQQSVGVRTIGLFRSLLHAGPYAAKARILMAARPQKVRPALVSFSGADGTEKTVQVSRLQHQLDQLGVTSARQWGGNVHLPGSDNERIPGALRSSPAGRQAWTLILVVRNALYLWGLVLRRRPGTAVLVLDQFTPDCAAKLDLHLCRSHSIASQWQRRLFALISPEPDAGFLVAVPDPVADSRHSGQTPEEPAAMSEIYDRQVGRFRLHRLDGTDPADVVATAVWRALP